MVLMGTVPEVLENLPYPRSYKVHRKMCSELMRLVNEIVNIFPDIEAALPRCSSGLQALCSLNTAVEKAKLLLQYCSESSKLYMALTGNVIVSRCRRTRNMLEQSLNEIQNMVPVMLAVRISQIVDELRTAVFALDPSEEEARKVVLELLQPGSTENCEAEAKAVQFAAFRLGITSPKEILLEKRSIKNLLNKVADSDPKKKKILKYIFHLLTRHGSLVLEKQAENAPDHPEDQSEVVTNVGSQYAEALEVGLGVERRLAVLNANATSFGLQSRLATAVDAPMANPEQTNSFLPSQVVGRDDDVMHDLSLSLAGFDEHQPLEAVNLDKMKGEKIIAAINFVLELPSAVLEQQVSSNHKHGIALALMLLSFVALFVCFAELVLRGRRCGWKWRSQRPFCSAFGVVGFVCAICQCIFTAVNYALVLRHVNIRIQVAVMPIIFALVQLCCTFRTHSNQSHSEADQA